MALILYVSLTYFIGQSLASSDKNSLKHFGIEIRTALNYQTECIRRELSNLTSVSIFLPTLSNLCLMLYHIDITKSS